MWEWDDPGDDILVTGERYNLHDVVLRDIDTIGQEDEGRLHRLAEEQPGAVNEWITGGPWEGATLLWVAARLGLLPLCQLLVALGADVNKRTHSAYLNWRREAPVHTAARFGHAHVLAFLVDVPGMLLHRFKDDGASPLFLTVQEGHLEATRVLLKAGGDLCFPRKDGTLMLRMALQRENQDLVEWLLTESRLPTVKPADYPLTKDQADMTIVQSRRLDAKLQWLDLDSSSSESVRRLPAILLCLGRSERVLSLMLQNEAVDVNLRLWYSSASFFEEAVRRNFLKDALLIASSPRFVPDYDGCLTHLSRLVCMKNLSVEDTETAHALVRRIFDCSFSNSLNPFLVKEADRFRGQKMEKWWQLVNQAKVWSPSKHALFPKDFRQGIFMYLLCMQRITPTLTYPIPKPILFDVVVYLSRMLYVEVLPDNLGDVPDQDEGAGDSLDSNEDDDDMDFSLESEENSSSD